METLDYVIKLYEPLNADDKTTLCTFAHLVKETASGLTIIIRTDKARDNFKKLPFIRYVDQGRKPQNSIRKETSRLTPQMRNLFKATSDVEEKLNEALGVYL